MKKIICLLLAFILVFALIACSDSDPVDDGQTGGTEDPDTNIPNYPNDNIFTDENGNQNLPIIPVT